MAAYLKKLFYKAYNHVVSGSGTTPGPDGFAAADFYRVKPKLIRRLVQAFQGGSHPFGPVRWKSVIGLDGKIRKVAIPNFVDRIMYRVLAVLLNELDQLLPGNVVGFRPAITLATIISSVRNGLRKWPHFITIDLTSFFPSIPDQLIHTTISALPLEPNVRSLLQGAQNTDRKNWTGVAQGVNTSPALANHAMRPFDEQFSELAGFYVRYADNLIAAFPSAADLDTGSQVLAGILQEAGFQLRVLDQGDWSEKPVEFLGLQIGIDSIRPNAGAIRNLELLIDQDRAAQRISGWINHYLSAGVNPALLNHILKSEGLLS